MALMHQYPTPFPQKDVNDTASQGVWGRRTRYTKRGQAWQNNIGSIPQINLFAAYSLLGRRVGSPRLTIGIDA